MRARGTRSAVGAAVGLVAGMLLLGGGPRAVSAQGSGTFSLPLIDNAPMWPIVRGLPNILVNKVLYSTLVKYDPKNWTPVGDLAERYGGRVSLAVALWSMPRRSSSAWRPAPSGATPADRPTRC